MSAGLFGGALWTNSNTVDASSSIVLLTFKHNAYRYNRNGKRIGKGYIMKGSTYYSKVLIESMARSTTNLILEATSLLRIATYQLVV